MQSPDGSPCCQRKDQELPQNDLDDPGSRREYAVTGIVQDRLSFHL